MPLPMPPTTLSCPKCGWHKTVVPKSDVLIEGHTWFTVCPQCGHAELERKEANGLSGLVAEVQQRFEIWQKKRAK
ncbi:hypothetical protein M8828_11010 [Aeromonas simiae]|uniref:hypothetical protein n=1 Tax=Aeromonas simiae TaxID=218936 RepID=UPI00266BFFB7|nr:hypothetical protein [Aeromonas simiae]MDO2949084.1 hypothetical protein [Aeromonas simiae]MDO2956321.1 hypothetical protein [Aeromonas simiae]